jgi:hypothetical protein
MNFISGDGGGAAAGNSLRIISILKRPNNRKYIVKNEI